MTASPSYRVLEAFLRCVSDLLSASDPGSGGEKVRMDEAAVDVLQRVVDANNEEREREREGRGERGERAERSGRERERERRNEEAVRGLVQVAYGQVLNVDRRRREYDNSAVAYSYSALHDLVMRMATGGYAVYDTPSKVKAGEESVFFSLTSVAPPLLEAYTNVCACFTIRERDDMFPYAVYGGLFTGGKVLTEDVEGVTSLEMREGGREGGREGDGGDERRRQGNRGGERVENGKVEKGKARGTEKAYIALYTNAPNSVKARMKRAYPVRDQLECALVTSLALLYSSVGVADASGQLPAYAPRMDTARRAPAPVRIPDDLGRRVRSESLSPASVRYGGRLHDLVSGGDE